MATSLLACIESELTNSSTTLTARLLDRASEGGSFLERFDLHPVGTQAWDVGGERFDERRYTPNGAHGDGNEPVADVPETVPVDGTRGSVRSDETVSGVDAPFVEVYDEDNETLVGFFCSYCGATSVTADGLDRLECGECGNTHRSDEWDPAYL